MITLFGAAACASASFAHAESNLFFGFSDDGPKWGGAAAADPGRAVGASAFRITLQWVPGETDLTPQDITDVANAVAGTSGLRLVLSVFGNATSAPQDDASRTQFCTYAKNVVARFPSINDVVIWNEPNVSAFWRPQFNPDALERRACGLRGPAGPLLGRPTHVQARRRRDRPRHLAARERQPTRGEQHLLTRR